MAKATKKDGWWWVMRIIAVLEKHGRWYVGSVKGVPGVNTQGRTIPSTLRNLAEAYQLIAEANEAMKRQGGGKPPHSKALARRRR
jgi:predicted RNase H-like HicB family nuclease